MIEEKPNIKLIDEDKTVTISLYTYNKLMLDSFKLQNAKDLYDVTKEKLDNIFNTIKNGENYTYIKDIMKKITNIYYDINEDKEEDE